MLDDSFSEFESIRNSIDQAYHPILEFLSWLHHIQLNPDLSRHQAYQFLLDNQIGGLYIQDQNGVLLCCDWRQTNQPKFQDFIKDLIKDLINEVKGLVQDRLSLLVSLLKNTPENSTGSCFFNNRDQTEERKANHCNPTY